MAKISVDVGLFSEKDSGGYRDRIDLLRARSGLLEGRDKVLMEMYLANGSSFRQMARVAEVNETTIARKIHGLVKRLVDGQYITCLRNKGRLDALELRVAKDYFLGGLGQRKIAKKQAISTYRVRKILGKIQAIVAVSQAEGKR